MKQLLFLLLLPCLALAQYPGNAGQKITLGEQTTADGLIWRGVANDTTLTAKSDTAAYFVLDTVNLNLFTYKASASGAKWRQLGADTAAIAYVNTYGTQTVNGAKTFTSAVTATRFNPTANTVTGTGMFAPAENTLGFSTNGVQRMHITSTGNVGFGAIPFAGYHFQVSTNSGSGNEVIFVVNNIGTTPNSLTSTRFDFGVFSDVSNYVATNTVLGQTNYIGQANDARYVAGKIDVIVTNAGNVGRANGHSGIMRFYTKPTNATGVSERMRINEVGNVGIGQTTPTALLHLKAGTATASTAPLKFTSGTNLTTAEAGAMEFNGTNLFFSPSTTRHTVNHGLTGSATLNFPSTTTLLSADLTITVTGAAAGDVVSLGVPNAAVNANTCYTAWVSAANTVTVRFNNYSSGTVDPASALFKVFVTK